MNILFLLAFSILFAPIYGYHQFSSQYNVQNTEEIIEYLKDFLPNDPIILECGAMNGDDTLKFSKMWPLAKIYAFEPIPDHFNNIKQRFQDKGKIKIYQLALADKNGKFDFYVSDFNNEGKPGGSSSLLPPKDHLKFDDKVTFNKIITVDAITLDDWAKKEKIDHIDFMWLDMQGFELNMLKPSKMLKNTSIIYMEVEFVEAYEGQYLYPTIKEWMRKNGFDIIALDFDEKLGLLGDKIVKPGANHPYYGNAVFMNTEKFKDIEKILRDKKLCP